MRGDPEGPEDLTPEHPRPVTLFMGEVIQRRHPALVALVFLFALFLAAVPFLFRYERSPFPEALSLYDRVCSAVASDDVNGLRAFLASRAGVRGGIETAFLASTLRCVNRREAKTSLEALRDASGERAYLLTLLPADGSGPVRFRVVAEQGTLLWWPEATR